MKQFCIATITNDITQYVEMKSSFVEAGFDDSRCTYVKFDNVATANAHEPYGVLRQLLATTEEKYLILCHHDVRIDGTHGYDDLVRVLTELEREDPRWAVAGNAGRRFNYEFVMRFHHWQKNFRDHPERVHTLDENFLIIKVEAGVRCSISLAGFHFYGTDLCLDAILSGRSCYVIDFRLSHFGRGEYTPDFWRMRECFRQAWRKKFLFGYVHTPCVPVFLSRFDWIDRIFSDHFYEFRMMTYRVPRWFSSLELRIRSRLRLSNSGRNELPHHRLFRRHG